MKADGYRERHDGLVLEGLTPIDFDRKGFVVLCASARATTFVTLDLEDGTVIGAIAVATDTGMGVISAMNADQMREFGAGLIAAANVIDGGAGKQ